MKPLLIGLTGPAGCGKDTVASYLGYSTYAFARPLKNALAVMGFPEPTREMKEAIIPGFDFSWRKAAQTLGTEWGRELQSDIWLAMAKRFYAEFDSREERLVITDVRFHNEADWVRDNGKLVHIQGRQSTMGAAEAKHASENALPVDRRDYILYNSGSMADLADEVQNLLMALALR